MLGCDRDLRCLWLTDPGNTFEGLIGTADSAQEILGPVGSGSLIEAMRRALETGTAQTFDGEVLTPLRRLTVTATVSPQRQGSGSPTGVIVAGMELAHRSGPEAAIAESQMRLDLAVQAADLGIWDWDLGTNRFVYSKRAREICGFPLDGEVTYEDIIAVTHPEDLPYTSAQARRALDPDVGERRPFRYRILRRDGAIRWVVAHGYAVFDDIAGERRAVRYVGTLQDITEVHLLEKARQDGVERLHLALDAGRMAVWEADSIRDTVETSPELNRILGLNEAADAAFGCSDCG